MLINSKLILTDELVFTDLVNTYCREFNNWSRYLGVPRYDHSLAEFMLPRSHQLHLRIEFSSAEVFIPLQYFSITGQHKFHFPAFERDLKTQKINEIDSERFLQLILTASEPGTLLGNENTSKEILQSFHAKWEKSGSEDIQDHYASKISIKDLQSNWEEGQSSSFESLITASAKLQSTDTEKAALNWLSRYFEVALPVLIRNASRLTEDCPDCVLQLDEKLNPEKVAFPDINEAMYDKSEPLSIEQISQFTDKILLGNFIGLISLAGKLKLCSEMDLLKLLYAQISLIENDDRTGTAAHLLHSRFFEVKGAFSNQHNAYTRKIANVLHQVFLSEALISPCDLKPVFSKHFEQQEITITIRPFNIDSDLERVHQWFHQDHAKAIWKMDWPLKDLEAFYRTLLPENLAQSYIGEINGEPTFNFEVYWATRDVVGNYFDVLPTDYGTHLFIAPVDKHKKYPSQTMQTIMDWLFAQPEVGRLVGEGAVESLPALMNKLHAGFRLQGVIEMPHKKANLNFCYREWYWEKFPQNSPEGCLLQDTYTTNVK